MSTKWLSEAELRARFGSLVDEVGDRNRDGVAEPADVEAAILVAESRAESDLLGQFLPGDLPTTNGAASAALKRVVGGLAIWYLAERLPIKSQAIYDFRTTAEKELASIRRGNISLLLVGNPTSDLGGALILSTSGADRTSETGALSRGVFTTESLEDM